MEAKCTIGWRWTNNFQSNGTRRVSVLNSSIISSVENPVAISFSMYINKQSLRNPSSILFRSLVLTSFIAENARSVVAVETGKVRTRRISLSSSLHVLQIAGDEINCWIFGALPPLLLFLYWIFCEHRSCILFSLECMRDGHIEGYIFLRLRNPGVIKKFLNVGGSRGPCWSPPGSADACLGASWSLLRLAQCNVMPFLILSVCKANAPVIIFHRLLLY